MGRIFRATISNMTSLLLALTLAVFIWATAVREANPDAEQTLPLSVELVRPDELIILNTPIETVNVTFTGPQNSLDALDADNFTATLDLTTMTEAGRETIAVQINPLVQLDENLQMEVNPPQAIVEFDFEVTRTLPVVVSTQGSLPPTHSLGEIIVVPDEIEVTGPESRIDELKEARTTVFLSNNVQQTFAETRRLTIFSKNEEPVGTASGVLTFNTTQASVTTEIIENESIADITVRVALEGLPAPGYRLLSTTAEPRSILVQGPPETLNRLRVIETNPVPITGLNSSALIPVAIELPEGVEPLNTTQVVVAIDIDRIMTTGVFEVVPNMIELSPELTATIPISTVRVTLFGPLDTLDALSADDIRVDVPLSQVTEGTNIVVPIVTPPEIEQVEIRSFFPSIITLIVTSTVTETEELPESSWRTVPQMMSGDMLEEPLRVANTLPIAVLPRRYTLFRL